MFRIDPMKRPTTTPGMSAEQFQAALAALNWKQSDFADRTGLTRQTVNRWATGFAPPPPWAAAYLEAMQDLAALHRKYLATD